MENVCLVSFFHIGQCQFVHQKGGLGTKNFFKWQVIELRKLFSFFEFLPSQKTYQSSFGVAFANATNSKHLQGSGLRFFDIGCVSVLVIYTDDVIFLKRTFDKQWIFLKKKSNIFSFFTIRKPKLRYFLKLCRYSC